MPLTNAQISADGAKRERGLIRSVLLFAIVIGTQTFLAALSVHTLSTVRAYVGGESLWTKGQKDAIYFLSLYSQSGDETYFKKYKNALAVPLGDLEARHAMEEAKPEYRAATAGFLQGGNPADDVPGLIWLFVHFREVIFLRDAVEKWRATDDSLNELAALGETVRIRFTLGGRNGPDLSPSQAKIAALNERLTPLAKAFSDSLGAGSRAIEQVLIDANIAVATLLLALITWRTRTLLQQRRTFQEALTKEKRRAEATLGQIGEAVIRVDAHGAVEYLNPMAERLLDASSATVLGAPLERLLKLTDRATGKPLEVFDEIVRTATTNERVTRADLNVVQAESAVAVSMVCMRIEEDDGTPGVVILLHDMSAQQELFALLSWQASHDHLTQLANRREFERLVELELERQRLRATPHALAIIDLDQFKVVNDSCGHEAGDELLRRTTQLLGLGLRKGDVLARLGGDEFALLMTDCDAASATEIAEKLRKRLEEASFSWAERAFHVTASFGLVLFVEGQADKNEALRMADRACYLAKEKGRNRVEAFDSRDAVLREAGRSPALQAA